MSNPDFRSQAKDFMRWRRRQDNHAPKVFDYIEAPPRYARFYEAGLIAARRSNAEMQRKFIKAGMAR